MQVGWYKMRLETDQNVYSIIFHVKEIQLNLGRNRSQTAEVFNHRGVEALICWGSNFHVNTEKAPERRNK